MCWPMISVTTSLVSATVAYRSHIVVWILFHQEYAILFGVRYNNRCMCWHHTLLQCNNSLLDLPNQAAASSLLSIASNNDSVSQEVPGSRCGQILATQCRPGMPGLPGTGCNPGKLCWPSRLNFNLAGRLPLAAGSWQLLSTGGGSL